jgi:hypothetical protein
MEGDDVLQGRGIQIGHRADRAVGIGVGGAGIAAHGRAGPELLRQQMVEQVAIGHVVVALALLLLDHLALGVQVLSRHRQMSQPLGLQPQRQLQRPGRHRLEVVRPVEAGGGIRRPAHRLDGGQVLPRGDPAGGAREHQVLEEMGEAEMAGALVGGTDPVPDVDRHRRAGHVRIDHHPHPVVEGGRPQLDVSWHVPESIRSAEVRFSLA